MTVKLVVLLTTTNLTAGTAAYGAAVPAGVTQTVAHAVFTNRGSTAVPLMVHNVVSGGSPDTTNIIITTAGKTLLAGETFVAPELSGLRMVAGGQLFICASTSVNATIGASHVT